MGTEDCESLHIRMIAHLSDRKRKTTFILDGFALREEGLEIAGCIAEGTVGKTLPPVATGAGVLSIAPRTVAFHKYRMMDELGLKTNAELLQFAIHNNILSA